MMIRRSNVDSVKINMQENDVVILRIQVLIYDDENNYGDFKDDENGNKYCDFII